MVASLDDYCACASASTCRGANGSAFPATGDGANEGANACADSAPLNGSRCLIIFILDLALVIYPERLSIRRTEILDKPGEFVRSAIAQTDALEV